jgi:hypothetical protein
MTELAASYTGTQAVIADTDRLVLKIIGKVVLAFGHGADENAYAFVRRKALNVILNPDHLCLEAQRDFPAFRRKMISYGVLDDFQKLFLRVGGSYGQFMEQLDHKASKALEGARDANCRADFDEDSFGGVNIDLELSSFVYRRVEKSKQALMETRVSGSSVRISICLAHVGCQPDA